MGDILGDFEPMVVLTDDDLDPHHLLMEGLSPEEYAKPSFSVNEMAKVFFARTGYWVRWREGRGQFLLDGVPIANKRTQANGDYPGQRRYNLADVELIAHALAQRGAITRKQLRQTLFLVKAIAQMWGII